MKTYKLTTNVFAVLCMFILTGTALQAQVLWSPSFIGGATNAGTLLQINADGSGFTTVYNFNESNGSGPMGSVVQCANGKVYGCCVNGGADSSCVLYCYEPTTHTYTDLWDFDITHGDFPMSGPIQGPNGLLYGAASAGGAGQAGVIYSFDPVANLYTDLYELDSSTAYGSCGSPVLATNGQLYGITSGTNIDYYGSSVNAGCIYSYNISSNTFTNLHSFAGVTDGYGFGSLIEHNGLLYGMTSGTPQYASGLFYDMFNVTFFDTVTIARVNYGNIFSFNPATQAYTNLYTFDSTTGMAPYGSLYFSADGKLYGVTSAGGANNLGVIFNFDLSSNAFTKMYDFDGTHGATPMSDVTQSTDGNLYGSTTAGGTSSLGVTYRFNPSNSNLTVLNNFDGAANGAAPLGGAFAPVNLSATGILAPVANQSISAYPVPAHNNVTVTLHTTPGETPVFTLRDINGRTIWGPQSLQLNANGQAHLDLSTVESGVYFLQATTGSNVITQKIVRE